MLTVDVSRLPAAGRRALDLGCGGGRHAYALLRGGADVVALDLSDGELPGVRDMFAALAAAGEVEGSALAAVVRGDAARLPFPDATFDVVVAAEVLEHLDDDRGAIEEIARVLRPAGVLAVTVPRWWPEQVCWVLSDDYHEVDGGHVRIYRRGELYGKLRDAGFRPSASHHAHALHSPYWWLVCVFGREGIVPRAYHRLLVWDLTRRPVVTRVAERFLNPVAGKSLVVYAEKL